MHAELGCHYDLQALMPVAVFVVGCAFGTEKYNGGTLVNMLIVSLGVAIASYGNSFAYSFLPSSSSMYFNSGALSKLDCSNPNLLQESSTLLLSV